MQKKIRKWELVSNDSILIQRILNSDNEAFASLVKIYQNRIYGFLFHMTLSREDAEDLTQDTFINVYKNLYKFKKDRNFLPWALKIALNLYREYYTKKKKKGRELRFDDLPEQFLLSSEDSLLFVEHGESLKEILSIIDELKKGQKEVFILKFSKGLTFKEIGEILSISESAARMKYFRAKESLMERISNNEKRSV